MNINAVDYGGSYVAQKNASNKNGLNEAINKGKDTIYTIAKGTEELKELLTEGNTDKEYKELEDLTTLTLNFINFMLEEETKTTEEPKTNLSDVLINSLISAAFKQYKAKVQK